MLLTASSLALDRPDRMVRRMSKRRRSIFSPSLENSSMPERDASVDRAHALPVDAHQRRHGAPGRVHAQLCDLPLEVTRVRALASRHGTIATVTPCSAQSTLRGACSSRSLAQPMSRCRQRRTPSQSYGRLCFVKRWCAVLPWTAVRVTGQLSAGLPSAGFVWFWLFCYCMRAWVLR